MRNLLTLLALLLAIDAARAELIIYSISQRTTQVSDGSEARGLFKGWLVLDTESAQSAILAGVSAGNQKKYIKKTGSTFRRSTVTGTNGKTYTILSEGVTDDGSSKQDLTYLKGVNGSLRISASRVVSFPSRFSGIGRNLFVNTDKQVLLESTISLNYLSSDTVASNGGSETFDAAVARYESWFTSRNYDLAQ